MKINQNGYRWKKIQSINTKTSSNKYDYINNGLLKNLLSNKIVNSKNVILQWFLNTLEQSFFFILKYIDYLNNFKKITKKNR